MLKNDLWIVGESYTGIYAPYIVWQLHLFNQNLSSPFKFPVKGFVVGNGVTDWEYDTEPALYDTLYNLNIIPGSIIDTLKTYKCRFNYAKPYNNSKECEEAVA